MITADRLIREVHRYIINEIGKSIDDDMKLGIAVGVGFFIGNAIGSGVLERIGCQHQDGMIDEDNLYNHILGIMDTDGWLTHRFPIVGDIRLSEDDMERLYVRMK